MDDPGLPEADHDRALGALARINALSRTAGVLGAAIAARVEAAEAATPAAERDPGPVRVVDVACGGGDVTVALAGRLARRAAVRGRPSPQVVGIDRSPLAIDRARRLAAARGIVADFIVADVTETECPACEVAVSSLFLHHLDDRSAARLLAALARSARLGFVISDLVRSRLGLWLAVVGTSLLSASRVARVDGPRSVRAARTVEEYLTLCEAAGLVGATVRRTWPERAIVQWPGWERATPAGSP